MSTKRNKVYSHTAKKIKCSCCNTALNKVFPHTHNDTSMYKIDNESYLCKSTKCTMDYMSGKFDEFENEAKNYTSAEEKEIAFMRECGTGFILKQKYGLELEE